MDICKRIILALVLGAMIVSCSQAAEKQVRPISNVETKTNDQTLREVTPPDTTKKANMAVQINLEEQQQLLDHFLEPFQHDLVKEKVKTTLEDKGALLSKGFIVDGSSVHVRIYLFGTTEVLQSAFDYLHDTKTKKAYHAVGTSNGGWLLWAYSTDNTEESEEIISDLLEVFLGEE